MKVIVAKGAGFCKGVKAAVDKALELAETYGKIYTLGELVHNELVTEYLGSKGVICLSIDQADRLKAGDRALIRAHGITREFEQALKERGVILYDATCPVVKHNQMLAKNRADLGDDIFIIGDDKHDEVVALKSYAGAKARVIAGVDGLVLGQNNVSILFQTTYLTQNLKKVEEFVENYKNFHKNYNFLVEIFNTICYTTKAKQDEARFLAEHSDALIVLGSRKSANTRRLAEVTREVDPDKVFWLENMRDAVSVAKKIKDFQSVSIVAGASTPPWLIREVSQLMSETQNAETEVIKEATLQDQSPAEAEVKSESAMTMDDYMKSDRAAGYIEYRVGKRVRGKVINANEDGINVWIGGKNDAFIDKSEATLDGNYNPADFKKDDEIQAVIIEVSKGQVKLSKKLVDEKKQEEAEIAKMLSGEFSLKMDGILTTKDGKRVGLVGKLGKHTIFVPASEIRIGYVNNLDEYVGKTLRLELLPPKAKKPAEDNAENNENVQENAETAAEVEKTEEQTEQQVEEQAEQQVRRSLPLFIRASQRRILEREKQAKEDEFWNSLHVNDIVTGKVKRFASFGAFVSVKGFDCLAHNTELSWNRISDPSKVLKIGESYDFVVLKADRETGKISLGYRQLQKKPYEIAKEKYPVGTVINGKVERIFSYGAFVSIEDGIDGLVHVSQISHNWIKDANEALKVGQEVEAQIIGFEDNRITLSIKALTPAPDETAKVVEESEATDEEKAVKRNSRLKKFEQKVNEGESRKERRPRKETSNEPKEWVSGSSSATLGDLFKGLNLNLSEDDGSENK